MRQLLLPRECGDAERLRLRDEEFHYLCNVLRCTEGESFPAVSPAGKRFVATIERIEEGSCIVGLSSAAGSGHGTAAGPDHGRSWWPELTLVQCVLKGRTFDELVRQATQAGVDRIIPVTSDRTVPRYAGGTEQEKKEHRWQRVAREAVQQSGAVGVPQIFRPISLERLLAGEARTASGISLGASDTLGLFLHEHPRDGETLHSYLESRPRKIVLFIGPEGGLSERECRSLEEQGCRPVYFGARVLRAETAAIFAIAAVQILVLESETWVSKRSSLQ